MADNLIFPIGFDLEKAVNDAGKEWDGKYADKLEKLIAKRPVNVKLKLDVSKLDQLDRVKQRLASIKLEPITPETKSAIKQLSAELTTLAKALEQVQKFSAARASADPNAVRAARINEINTRAEAKAKVEAQKAAANAALAEQRLAAARLSAARAAKVTESANKSASKSYDTMGGAIERAARRLVAYWSVRSVGNFLTKVREVTAEFELQRVSLGAIIQDQDRANQLFSEIKSFALTSQLKILDLTKYTKQVAAYGIETNKLFDTTKMLADISVGLGVDMSRLTLFLGQVYATGYLRSSEVRQATEAGIPLVDKLAKKLTEANGKLVTAADVMDLISKRAISFEQVEEVLRDMTSAGGEFYNMQVKQSQTLFGMWSKLGDAAAIMYDQIGNTESVNAGMKLAIRSLETIMRNWKTTARILDSVAVGLAIYVIGLKNASIATNELTGTTALLNLAHKQQVIQTPKIVAAIVGQNAATKLSTTLTNAHTVAVLRHATATNVLTRAFWKMTAAMLANPWLAITAAMGAAAIAIFHFSGNVETTSDRMEKLNNSVASFKNLEDTTGKLIDEYNTLIEKTERTSSEQKKLSEVTHELAKQYPGAITAIGNFGDEVELVGDKLNELYEAERNARMENTRNELKETEKKIKETEDKIKGFQKTLQSGKQTIVEGSSITGVTYQEVKLNDEDKAKILKQIDELRFGKDGQSGLVGLQKSAESARRALGLIPSEAAQAVEKFGAWKKTLTTFRKQLGAIRVSLFDDSTIAQFGTLEEALQKTAEQYKKNIALVKTYDETLKSTTLTSEERAKIESERAEADTMATLAKNALEYYNALHLLDEKGRGGGRAQSDPRLGILQEMVQSLKQINKEYDDLEKKEGRVAALGDVRQVYDATFKNMQALSKKYKFDLPNFGVPTDTASLNKYLNAIRNAMAKLPKSEKAVLALQIDIDKLDIDDQQKQIESQLKTLADNVSRTKTAKEFYDKILGATGDVELAASVSMSIYGDASTDVQGQMAEYISGLFGQVDVEVPLNVISESGNIDYTAMEKFVRENEKILGDSYKELLKIAQDGQKDLAKTYEGYLKDLEVAKTYADKRIELARDTANKIAEIEKSGLPQEEKERLIAGYNERESREASKLAYENFKNSALYVQVFEDLDNASKTALVNMRDRLVALKDEWKNLDPQQVKELTKRIEELDKQIQGRNPFESIAKSLGDLRKMLKSGRTKEGDAQKAFDAEKARAEAEAKMLADEKAYELAVKTYGAESEQAKAAKKTADASKKAYENAAKLADQTAYSAKEWKEVEDATNGANQKIDFYQQQVNDALGGIREMMESFGADEDTLQFFDDIVGGLNKIADAGQDAALAAGAFMTGNIFLGITKSISAIGGLVSGITDLVYAGRVRRANKEIKKQQELLDQLEYSYSRLEKSMEKAFGSDYIKDYQSQMQNLAAQIEAKQKQLEAERSKGKKKSDDDIKKRKEEIRDLNDMLNDMKGKVAEYFAGTDLTSAAREFAKSWLDAKLSFSDTTEAIEDKFKDMIKNMIVEQGLALVMQNALKPFFDYLNKASEDGVLSLDEMAAGVELLKKGMDNANNGAEVYYSTMEQAGIDLKSLYDKSADGYTGIAKDIAGATSEEINYAASIGNTIMYHTAYIPQIYAQLVAMAGGNVATPSITAQNAGWTDWQQQAMDAYTAIQRNTADTVVECRRSAQACEDVVAKLNSVIKYDGGTAKVYVRM